MMGDEDFEDEAEYDEEEDGNGAGEFGGIDGDGAENDVYGE
jgi:hypothetical protein